MLEELSQHLTAILLPYLPYLLGPTAIAAKDAAIKAMAGKFVEAAWDKAVCVWENLGPEVEKKPEIKKSLEKLVRKGTDPRVETTVAWELEKLLEDLPSGELAKLQDLLKKINEEDHTAMQGRRTVNIGRDAKDNIIIMGDGGRYNLKK